MSEGSDSSPASQPPSNFSCHVCKRRKLKCDRNRPSCDRCVKAGERCDYPSTRKRPVMTATRPRVRDLAARIHELEGRIEAESISPKQSQASPTQLIAVAPLEELPSPPVIEELTTIFFTKLQSDTSMIQRDRYITSLYGPSHLQPPICLQYTILAAGASASSLHDHLAEVFYVRARQYIQADEMKSDNEQISLAHVQSWILLGHFEAQHLWFSRASMSIARAIRLSQILGLHRLDSKNVAGLTLPPPADLAEDQERRRTFWVMFCTDRITSSTGGWPTMIDARSIQTRLPAIEDPSSSTGLATSITLKQALRQDMWGLSTAACRIVAVHLFNECFNFSRGDDDDDDDYQEPPDNTKNDVWQRLQQLDNSLMNAFSTLPLGLRCPDNVTNTDAVFINLQLHTALICIYRAATTRSRINIGALPQIHSRVSNSALQIVTIVALVADINTCFRNPLISFAAYITASFFLTDFMESSTRQSEEKFVALMDLMIEVGKSNTFTASLAIRLARTLTTSGLDPSAIEKIEMLIVGLRDTSIPGQEDEESGVVRLCPLPGQPTNSS